MSDLISRQAAIDAIRKSTSEFSGFMEMEMYTDDDAVEAIDGVPSAEPVRHGKWELAEDGWYCSACGMYPPFDCDPEEKGIPYCPHCGARMDKG